MSDWEKSVIGSVIKDPLSYEEADLLNPSDFSGVHRIIWAEIQPLASRGGLDARSLVNALNQSQDKLRLEKAVGSIEVYIDALQKFAGTAMDTYVEKVLDGSIRRGVKENAALIAAEADGNTRTANDLLDYAERKMASLRRDRGKDHMTMADLVGIFMPRLEGMRDGTISPAYIPQMDAIREVMLYAEASESILVASRPGMGKSSVIRAEHIESAKIGIRTALFNFENDPMDYGRHFIANLSGINGRLIKEPKKLTPELLRRVREAAEILARLPLILINAPGWSAAEVCRKARRLHHEAPIKLMSVDYVQLVRNGIEKRHEDIEMTSGILRAFALELGIPQFNAAQINREVDRRKEDDEIVLADLRGSGSLENDNTVIIFPRLGIKPSLLNGSPALGMFPENRVARGGVWEYHAISIPLRMHFAKNRNGEPGYSHWVKWDRSINVFSPLSRDWQPPA